MAEREGKFLHFSQSSRAWYYASGVVECLYPVLGEKRVEMEDKIATRESVPQFDSSIRYCTRPTLSRKR